ncbi:MAG: hypothetical protein LC794_19490 [Acidobacteria bacterium]|nr:hypothetical protein [Acidobacteriota bacterium]
MRSANILVFLLFLTFISTTAHAQEPTSAAESLEKLRLQLIEVQAREESLLDRAQQLDEALKPENIERSLAGIGSTRPEELREARRRQLQAERDGIAAQLQTLETSRLRLEVAIRDAETRAYHDSAKGTAPPSDLLVAQSPWGTRWLVSGSASVVVAGLVAGLFIRRRLRRKS